VRDFSKVMMATDPIRKYPPARAGRHDVGPARERGR
jgi:hypothetical protein